jgi:uncharacterized membrane protein YhdT
MMNILIGILKPISNQIKTLSILLIVIVGLFNFHIPHFLLEPAKYSDYASRVLELVLLANLLGTMTAAIGVYRNARWGWLFGIAIAGFCVILYVAQETVGLPGLPKVWWEPSRIVSLIAEALFVALAYCELR